MGISLKRAAAGLFAIGSAVLACSAGDGTEKTVTWGENLNCEGAGIHPASCGGGGGGVVKKPLTPRGCYYDPGCKVTNDSWSTVRGPLIGWSKWDNDYLQYLQSEGCTEPRDYEPAGGIQTWPISMCPAGTVRPGDHAMTMPCDECTGAIPRGWELVTWDPEEGSPSGCHTPNCPPGTIPPDDPSASPN